jgi:hypothetical protein
MQQQQQQLLYFIVLAASCAPNALPAEGCQLSEELLLVGLCTGPFSASNLFPVVKAVTDFFRR